MGKADKNYKCSNCEKLYKHRQHLSRHKKKCLGLVKFECAKSFTRKDSLEDHNKISKRRKEKYCKICCHEFDSTWRLKRHTTKAFKSSIQL